MITSVPFLAVSSAAPSMEDSTSTKFFIREAASVFALALPECPRGFPNVLNSFVTSFSIVALTEGDAYLASIFPRMDLPTLSIAVLAFPRTAPATNPTLLSMATSVASTLPVLMACSVTLWAAPPIKPPAASERTTPQVELAKTPPPMASDAPAVAAASAPPTAPPATAPHSSIPQFPSNRAIPPLTKAPTTAPITT